MLIGVTRNRKTLWQTSYIEFNFSVLNILRLRDSWKRNTSLFHYVSFLHGGCQYRMFRVYFFGWKFYECDIYGKSRRKWNYHETVAVIECDASSNMIVVPLAPRFTGDDVFVEDLTRKQQYPHRHPPFLHYIRK